MQQVAHQNEIAREVLRLERQAIEAFEKVQAALGQPRLPETVLRARLPNVSVKAFDWTNFGKVTPIRDQGSCGSCWDFAAVAALESSILIRYNRSTDLSEQYILDNAIFGSCGPGGGWTPEAFTEMMLLGTAKESDLPYDAENPKKRGPRLIVDNPYRALIWGFVGNGIEPTVPELKAALLLHGPLAVSLEATDSFQDYFNNYPGQYPSGVFNEHARGRVNHVVLLVGWDDARNAWRIKNSWGTKDKDGSPIGDNGFGWVAYGSNSVGFGATWVEALNTLFSLPPELLEWLNKAKKLAQDSERELKAAAEQAQHTLEQAQAAADRAKSDAAKASKDAAEKARAAVEQARIAADKQKEVAAATTQAERHAKEAAAKAAKEAADRAQAEAAKAQSAADHAAGQAQDAANSAAKAVSDHIPSPPDPRKHLPHF
jgi:cell division septum initiation protein DivIVA